MSHDAHHRERTPKEIGLCVRKSRNGSHVGTRKGEDDEDAASGRDRRPRRIHKPALVRDLRRRREIIAEHLDGKQPFATLVGSIPVVVEVAVHDSDSIRRWLHEHGFPTTRPLNFGVSISVTVPTDASGRAHTAEHTPMSLACALGELTVARWLYEHGREGDATRKNKLGFSPFAFACMFGRRDVIRWLYQIKAAS